jgi:periplasmic/secreted protein
VFKKLFASLLQKTEPARRNVKVAALVGVIGGVFSAIVKFGWEVPFPPRTPARNATNPPQTMLEWFGMSPEQSHTTVSFNLNDNLPIYSFIIHFSFAIVFALLYCIAAEYFPKIKLWQGAAFGLLVWIGAHVVFMPLLGWVPSPFPWVAGGQTWSEHFSEALGHVVWLWSIEIVRRDLRNRITRQPDPEVPLEQPYR